MYKLTTATTCYSGASRKSYYYVAARIMAQPSNRFLSTMMTTTMIVAVAGYHQDTQVSLVMSHNSFWNISTKNCQEKVMCMGYSHSHMGGDWGSWGKTLLVTCSACWTRPFAAQESLSDNKESGTATTKTTINQ